LAIANAFTTDSVNKFIPFLHVGLKIIAESEIILEVKGNGPFGHSQYRSLRCGCFEMQSPEFLAFSN
jgi:hypothetical protein